MGSVILFGVLFLICLVILYAFLTSKQLRDSSLLSKILGSGFILIVMGTFLYLTGNAFYDTAFGELEPVAPKGIANMIFAKYDLNKNGQVELANESRVDIEEGSHDWHTYSYQDLFRTADINQDSLVTTDELEKVILSYDADNSGTLTGELSYYHKIMGASQPNELKEFYSKNFEYRSNGRREK